MLYELPYAGIKNRADGEGRENFSIIELWMISSSVLKYEDDEVCVYLSLSITK